MTIFLYNFAPQIVNYITESIWPKKFAEHNGLNLTETNKVVLDSWNKNNVFQKSITEREGCPQFVFFEGPPFGKRTSGYTSCPCTYDKGHFQPL